MKNIIALFLAFFISHSTAYPQTGYRIKLISNLNLYPLFGEASYSALWGYTAPDGREYAILGCFNGTSFVDITDTNNIREADFLNLPPEVFGSIVREMKTYSHYAYIISEAFGSKIQIVDLQYLPDSIRYVGLSDIPDHLTTHTISQWGPYLYLNGGNTDLTSGIAVIDLSNPEIPILRGKWNDLYVHDSRIINDTIWACNIYQGKISIIDARNKDSLKNIRSWIHNPSPNFPHNIALTNNRHHAYITDETITPPGRMKIWNVSDLDNITYITSFNAYPFESSMVHNVEIHNNYAFVAYYSAGVKVLNITNPESPVEIGWFDTYPEHNKTNYDGCWAVYYFPSGKIIAADRKRGLFTLRPNLTNPVAAIPKAKFTVSDLEIRKLETLTLIDATDEVPTNWQWTVTGPENKTSTLKHPPFQFQALGQYNVKLRVSNSFGSDSISKTNVFKVIPATLTSFNITSPSGTYRIITSPTDTSTVLFSWTKSSLDTAVRYKLHFRRAPGPYQIFLPSSNDGKDTFSLLTKSFLDSLALQLGLIGDSVTIVYKAKAYNEIDSLASLNTTIIILRRNTVGIKNLGGNIPVEYRIYNNFPNPFNPSTNILIDIPKQSEVKLILYDLIGREVLKLFSEYLNAGSYKYSFNIGNLNSGAYFVRMKAGEYTSVIKIVLIK